MSERASKRLCPGGVVVALALVGCGPLPSSGTGTGPGPGTVGGPGGNPGGGFVEAAHVAPALAASSGGPTMPNAVLVPVLWQQDPIASQVQSFITELVADSSYVGSMTQYGAKTLSADAASSVSGALPVSGTDVDVRSILKQAINAAATNGVLPDVSNDLFVFVLPEGIAFTATMGNQTITLCTQASGYHSYLMLPNGKPAVYAVVGECGNAPPGYPTSPLDIATMTITHEVGEAITDPLAGDIDPNDHATNQPAYFQTSDLGWEIGMTAFGMTGGEIGDLCAIPSNYVRDSAGFLRQRLWSNAAAQAGLDPCGGATYLGAAPVSGVMQNLSMGISGLAIPAGQSQTIPLTFFSSAQTDAFTLKVIDTATLKGAPGNLSLSLSTSTGQNGTPVNLSITVTSRGTINGVPGVEALVIEGIGSDGTVSSRWPLVIASQ